MVYANQWNKGLNNDKLYILLLFPASYYYYHIGVRRGRDRLVVGFTTTYAISVYHH